MSLHTLSVILIASLFITMQTRGYLPYYLNSFEMPLLLTKEKSCNDLTICPFFKSQIWNHSRSHFMNVMNYQKTAAARIFLSWKRLPHLQDWTLSTTPSQVSNEFPSDCFMRTRSIRARQVSHRGPISKGQSRNTAQQSPSAIWQRTERSQNSSRLCFTYFFRLPDGRCCYGNLGRLLRGPLAKPKNAPPRNSPPPTHAWKPLSRFLLAWFGSRFFQESRFVCLFPVKRRRDAASTMNKELVLKGT